MITRPLRPVNRSQGRAIYPASFWKWLRVTSPDGPAAPPTDEP